MKRTCKEYTLINNDEYFVKYGSVNKDKPQVIYITCQFWIMPLIEIEELDEINLIFKQLKKQLKTKVFNSPYFNNNIILDYNFQNKFFIKNKKNFITFEIYLKQNKIFKLNEIKDILILHFNQIIKNLILNLKNNQFIVFKVKK